MLGCEASLQNNYVVLESIGTAADNYQKAISWVNTTFKNPDEVLKGQIENKYVRINGYASNMTAVNSMGMIYARDIKYSITIYVKDNKIKFEIGSLEELLEGTTTGTTGWYKFTGIPAYRKNGKVKKTIIPYVNKFENYFNNLATAVVEQDNMLIAETSDW